MTAEVVYSDPYGQLPFRSDKYSSACEEIYLGGKGINVLRDFESFVSLSVLWLNDNGLESLEGLESNFRLKEIYAHGNKIRSLHEDAFAQCTFLGRLTLSKNKLDDLENVLEELRPMNHLTSLDLFENPIAQEDNYRLRVIGELSTLTMLDRHEITAEEREEAKAFMKKMKKMSNFSLSKRKVVIPKFTPEEEEHRQAALNIVLQRLREKTFKYRINLEDSFRVFDKRCLYRVNADTFWSVLSSLNLSVEEIMDDYEKSLITDKYTVKVDQEAITMAGKIVVEMLHYRKLCEDVLRAEVRRYPDEIYKPDLAPEISHSTKDLMKYVKTVERKTVRLAEETRRAEMLASAAAAKGNDNVFGERSSRASKAQEQGLDDWAAGELIKIINGFKTDSFTPEQCESVMRKMMNFNYAPVQGLRGAKEALSVGGSKDSLSLTELKDALGVSLVASTDVPVIKWRPLKKVEQEKLASKVFADGANLLDTLLRAGPADDTAELVTRTASTGIHGTRLESNKKREAPKSKFITPSMALGAATKRADVVIIPNLLPDVVKEEKEAAILSKADWSKPLAKMGMKGEFLQVALERKKRSTLQADKRQKEREAEKAEAARIALEKAMSGRRGNQEEGGEGDKSKRKGKDKKKKKNLVPEDDGGPKGWASSTGFVTIDGRLRTTTKK